MVGENTRTFFDDETDLLLAERTLIADYVRETSDKDWNNDFQKFRDRARGIAEDWKRYAMRKRQDGMAPKLKIAVKHGAVLLSFPGNIDRTKKDLMYGVNLEDENHPSIALPGDTKIEKFPAYKFTILGPDSKIFGVQDSYARIAVYHTADLSRVVGCHKCPGNGLCDIANKCASYDSETYSMARRGLGIEEAPKDPTVDDYRTFKELTVSRKK